jgi:Tol biopolymer transport system component
MSNGYVLPLRTNGTFLSGAEFVGAFVSAAAWSPDGRSVVLSLEFQPGLSILSVDDLVRPSQTIDPPLTPIPDTAGATQPVFSPDGNQVAFIASGANASGPLHVRDLRTGADRVVAASASNPAWGTNGWIAYDSESLGRRADLFRVRSDGSGRRRMTFRGGSDPNWSPHGRRLVFSRGKGIFSLPLGGGTPRRLTRSGSSPVWSPDGRWVAFNRSRSPGTDCIYDGDCGAITYTYLATSSGARLHVVRRPSKKNKRGPALRTGPVEDWRPVLGVSTK